MGRSDGHLSQFARLLAGSAAACCLIFGCERAEVATATPVSSQEIRAQYTRLILEGLDSDGLEIRAGGIDDASGDLLSLRITSDTYMLSASRATLVIDTAADTVAIRMRDVVMVRTDDDGSRITTLETLVTTPIPVERDICDERLLIPQMPPPATAAAAGE
ncbi:MAG: hypothetical protein KAS72_00195 [Phycisphaerales bacterium]|nr:hypothetical protein [Phycisphaerales bacterium]